MKKNYLIFALLFSSILFGQVTNFNNGVGDGLWSTTGNWSLGLPGSGGNNLAALTQDVNLDIDVSLDMTTRGSVTVSGSGKLTSIGSSSVALLCNGDAGLTFNAKLVINADIDKNLQVNGSSRTLTFGASSVITLTTDANTVAPNTGSKVLFQGAIDGGANLKLNAWSTVFDTGSDNTAFTGDFLLGPNTVIANTTGDGAFLAAGSSLKTNDTGGTLTITGANSCDADFSVQADHLYTLDIDANQSTLGTLEIADTGTLTIAVDPSVTNLSFADSSAKVWGTGGVAITGYVSGEIRFGTSNTALTALQLSQISADGAATGEALGLDANGYLVSASTLSTNDLSLNNNERVSYPTVVENYIYFSKQKNNIQIYNITGSRILEVSKKNTIDYLSISHLNPGLYFIVFDGIKTEKFLKK